jgi:DNA-binding NtrC family response regulator
MHAYERAHIETVLSKVGNDKKEAAKTLGIALSSLYRKIEELGIAEEDTRTDERSSAG